MRPVNLIPPEDRRGDKAPMRTGNLAYVLVGGLAVLLLAVIATALTSKQISDKESEKQSLEQELVQATARADSLKAFADFRAVQETRAATVSSLAQSRFDWERVIRELALVLPADVQLVGLSGSVSAEAEAPESEGVSLRDDIPGPALELTGCAPGQDAVAGLLAALEDIDGVTRVGLASSERSDNSQGTVGGGATGGEGGDDQDCRVADFISRFEIVVAFDGVPTPGTATAAPAVPASAAPSGEGAQLADAQTEQAVSRASAKEQTAKADKARHNIIPGG
jgi:Tfp pilus assembly protein PilN